MIEAHELAAQMFAVSSNGCAGGGGRRSLRDDAAAEAELRQVKMELAQAETTVLEARAETELVKARAESALVEARAALAEERSKLAAAAATISALQAECGGDTAPLPPLRRRQQLLPAAVLAVTHTSDGAPHACVVAPCELDDGVCAHGGSCAAVEGGREGAFQCACVVGYEGARCEGDVDECASAPCQNGGECAESSGGGKGLVVAPGAFRCSCAVGYAGRSCGIDVDECASAPCLNGASCSESGGNAAVALDRYICDCAEGSEGLNCEHCGFGFALVGAGRCADVDECASAPCLNGAGCAESGDGGTHPVALGAYVCSCAGGFDGENCDETPPEPASSTCFSGDACNGGRNCVLYPGAVNAATQVLSIQNYPPNADCRGS
eukprot:SAG11_NODE_7428_length_1145_cov_1.413958_1_plen_381_part_11